MPAALTPAQLGLLKRRLLAKGAELSQKLARLLDGKPVPLEQLLVAQPGERPAERLKRFLATIDQRLGAIRDGSYGRCQSCGGAISFTELEQTPWADTCHACAGAA
jgi:hypothetical protein